MVHGVPQHAMAIDVVDGVRQHTVAGNLFLPLTGRLCFWSCWLVTLSVCSPDHLTVIP